MGVVAVQPPSEERACETKRPYTDPYFRNQGVWRALTIGIIEEGRDLGYDVMRLETVSSGTLACLGERSVNVHNPLDDAVYTECSL